MMGFYGGTEEEGGGGQHNKMRRKHALKFGKEETRQRKYFALTTHAIQKKRDKTLWVGGPKHRL